MSKGFSLHLYILNPSSHFVKEVETLKSKHGISIERWFIAAIKWPEKIEMINLTEMNRHYKRCIDEDYMKFWKYAKDKNLKIIETDENRNGQKVYHIYRRFLALKETIGEEYANTQNRIVQPAQEAEGAAKPIRGDYEALERILFQSPSRGY